jgi:chromosome segregation ATPase
MPTINEDLISAISEVTEAQRALAANLAELRNDETAFDPTKEIPGDYQTVSSLDSQLTAVSQSIKGIAEQSDLTFVPMRQLRSALSNLRQIIQHYSAANLAIAVSQPIHSIDPENFTFVGDDGVQRTIAKELKAIADTVEDMLADWHLLRLAAKSPRINDFATFLKINEKHRENLEGTYHDVQTLRADANSAVQSISALQTQATDSQTEIERVTTLAQADRKTTSEYLAEATTKLEGIRKVSSDATSLTESINEYSTEFERFKAQLDERTKKFADGTQELSNLVARLNNSNRACSS